MLKPSNSRFVESRERPKRPRTICIRETRSGLIVRLISCGCKSNKQFALTSLLILIAVVVILFGIVLLGGNLDPEISSGSSGILAVTPLLAIYIGMGFLVAYYAWRQDGIWQFTERGIRFRQITGVTRFVQWCDIKRIGWGGDLAFDKGEKKLPMLRVSLLQPPAREKVKEFIRQKLEPDFDLTNRTGLIPLRPSPKQQRRPTIVSFILAVCRIIILLVLFGLIFCLPPLVVALTDYKRALAHLPPLEEWLYFLAFSPLPIAFLCGFMFVVYKIRQDDKLRKKINPYWRERREANSDEVADQTTEIGPTGTTFVE